MPIGHLTQVNMKLIVQLLQGAKIIQASHFDYEYTLGHKISFVCVAKGSPRPQITWFKDGVELYAHLYQTVSKFTIFFLTLIQN